MPHLTFSKSGKLKYSENYLVLCFLLSELGNYSQIINNFIEEIKEFIRAILYYGNKKEIYANTRVKICKI